MTSDTLGFQNPDSHYQTMDLTVFRMTRDFAEGYKTVQNSDHWPPIDSYIVAINVVWLHGGLAHTWWLDWSWLSDIQLAPRAATYSLGCRSDFLQPGLSGQVNRWWSESPTSTTETFNWLSLMTQCTMTASLVPPALWLAVVGQTENQQSRGRPRSVRSSERSRWIMRPATRRQIVLDSSLKNADWMADNSGQYAIYNCDNRRKLHSKKLGANTLDVDYRMAHNYVMTDSKGKCGDDLMRWRQMHLILISTIGCGHWIRRWRALGGCGRWVTTTVSS